MIFVQISTSGPRFRYAMQPTVTKLAQDRAEQLKRDRDKVAQELENRLRADLRRPGDFGRVHPSPRGRELMCRTTWMRLVVFAAEHAASREPGNAAENAARAILETPGNSPRLPRKALPMYRPNSHARLRCTETSGLYVPAVRAATQE